VIPRRELVGENPASASQNTPRKAIEQSVTTLTA